MATWFQIRTGSEVMPFYCPFCGGKVFVPEQEYPSTFCPHVEFVFLDLTGDYDYISPRMQALLNTIDEEGGEASELLPWDKEILERLPATTVVFGLTCSGVACGPVSATLAIGIRWDAEVTDPG